MQSALFIWAIMKHEWDVICVEICWFSKDGCRAVCLGLICAMWRDSWVMQAMEKQLAL